ncbi:lipoprotein [Xanthobacter autotrophicus]|nr:lipoprotein [Xanthobacter autotrophicus]MDI4666238.1 lipoprotein [Xanthobacter autotrophicus]
MRPLLVPLALCGTLALAACGVKGPLEPPPGAHVTPQATPPAAKPAVQQAAATSAKPGTKPGATTDGTYVAPTSDGEILESATPHAEWQKKKTAPGASTGESPLLKDVSKPDQPFILDGLL